MDATWSSDKDLEEFKKLHKTTCVISSPLHGWKTSECIKLKNGNPFPLDSVELISLCDVSKYGDLKTQTTIQDDTVRKALEIPSSKLQLTMLY